MFGKSSHTFEINYIYQNDPRAETYDADVDSLSQGEAGTSSSCTMPTPRTAW